MTQDVIRTLDDLEDRADGYLSLSDCEHAVGRSLQPEIDDSVVLVDYRMRADGTPVTLARLNRRHPMVQALTNW